MRDSPARLLIVEDDDVIREVLVFTLADEGYAVETAADGQAALEQLAVSTPDVILLDMMLPVMDGWEFLTVRQQRQLAPEAKVVIISASRRATHVPPAELGVSAVVAKPFDLEHLLGAIQSCVTRG